MAEVLLFHHALGLTPGCLAFADELRAAGHVVHTPDLFEGNVFTELADGVGYAQRAGFGTIMERGQRAAESLPGEIVYAGFSLGVMPAQQLAQTRPAAKGVLLYHGAIPALEFGTAWPQGVPLQMHFMDRDPWAEEDLPAARVLAEEVEGAELYVYPGSGHLFADPSSDAYDEQAASLLKERTLDFLRRVDASG
jgi:dienelactone hydrolase